MLPDGKNIRIHAQALLSFTMEQLWETLTGEFTLVFDDGELVSNDKQCLYSAYTWEVQRRFPGAPLLKKHHVKDVIGDGRCKFDTHLELIGRSIWSTYEWLEEKGLSEDEKLTLRDQLAKLSYQITNTMYNDLSHRCEEYVGSINARDFVEIRLHPKMVEAFANLEPNSHSIQGVYGVLDNLLRKDPTIIHNPLARLYASDIVSSSQVQQCLGPRGFITDTNSEWFRTPVVRSYIDGLTGLYETIAESRSAAKALAFSKAPLQDAEYFSRRLQLVAMSVERLHHGDCGSTRYLEWKIRGPEYVEGKMTYKGDLANLQGKYYLDETSGKLKLLKKTDKHLIGTKVKMRSVLHCAHPDAAGVCSVCFGDLSLSVPRNTNIGHMCSTHMTQQSSQSVLSVKHLDGNATVEPIYISEHDMQFIVPGDDDNSYKFSPFLEGKKISIIINAERAPNLMDVYEVDDVYRLSARRVSEMDTFSIVIKDTGADLDIPINQKTRRASLSHAALLHVRKKGWTVSDDGKYFQIDMDGWNFSDALFVLPLKQFNMSDHSKDIAKILESSVKEQHKRDKFISPDALLMEFFDLVNSRLNVNLAPLEITLYSAMVVSAMHYDYSLPKPWTDRGVGVMRKTMEYRSVAAAMAFERHADLLTSPQNFVLTNRVDHPFDHILMPRETDIAYGRHQ